MRTTGPVVDVRLDLCTVVDYGYLPRALVLHRSLVEQEPDFLLRVVCMDEQVEAALDALALPHVVATPVADIEREEPALVAVKPTRTLPEYCWTLKASALRQSFDREPDVAALAYIDADHMFWNDPTPIWQELGDGSVLVVPQRTADERVGRYNAGFVLFRRSDTAFAVLDWWRERCLERCEATFDGPVGDQGYLTEWPERFAGIRELRHPGGGLAPWSSPHAELELRDGTVFVEGEPLVFFHHQSFRIYEPRLRWPARLRMLPPRYHFQRDPVALVWSIGRWYELSSRDRALLWNPYARRFSEAVATIRDIDPLYHPPSVHLAFRKVVTELGRSVAGRTRRAITRRRISRAAHRR